MNFNGNADIEPIRLPGSSVDGAGGRNGSKEREMKSWSVCLMFIAACGIIYPSTSARPFEFVQGVIVDARHGIIYMSNSRMGIDAVGLSTGEVIANSTRGVKPLQLYGDVLLAEAQGRSNALNIIGLTAKDLKPIFDLEIPIPVEARQGSFYVGARVDGNEIILRWRSIRRPIRAIPTREPANVIGGFARVDPATGRLITVGEGEPPAPTATKIEIPAALQQLTDHAKLASQLCPIDDMVAALEYVEERGEQHLKLLRWRKTTNESLPTVRLFGQELTFRTFSRDCRHLLASSEMNGWVWHLYSTTSGEQTAEFHNDVPGAEFFVFGTNLIYQAPADGQLISGSARINTPRLVALDINSGKEIWARPIGLTAYLESNPPMEPVGTGHK
jgi:hypothetical protein